MAYTRIPGSAGRYTDTETGGSISRRQFEMRTRLEMVVQRERRYVARKQERRESTGYIPAGRNLENKRYWAQRWAEQEAVRSGSMDSRVELQRAWQPGSAFNRLWAEAELNGFDGGQGSAWDSLAMRAGAKGGIENEHERNRYLAVIAWHERNDVMGDQRWLEKGADGKFVGTPAEVRQSA